MKSHIRRLTGWGGILALFCVAAAGPAPAQETLVRAKIGILIHSGDQTARAKTSQKIRAGDRIRIYVQPEKDGYIYVIHSDHHTATLLNAGQEKITGGTLVMPSVRNFFEVDGSSQNETIAIICSPTPLQEVSGVLGTGQAPHEKWVPIETALDKKSRIDLSAIAEKPFTIAGNVRGTGETADPFIDQLSVYSGKTLVLKRYAFRVEK